MSGHVTSIDKLQISSPLDTLVRKTSSRRRPNPIQTSSTQAEIDQYFQHASVPMLDAPPRRPISLPPQSPLLHTSFRASVATQSSFNTSTDLHGHTHARMASGSQDTPYDDDISVYSTVTASLPNPGSLSNTPPVNLEYIPGSSNVIYDPLLQVKPSSPPSGLSSMTGGQHGHSSRSITTDSYMYQRSQSQIPPAVPTVVVSAEESEGVNDYESERGNALSSPVPDSHFSVRRIPSALPKNMNFSRPVKPGGASEEAKRQVLARNAFRSTLHPNSQPSLRPLPQSSPHRSGHSSPFEATHSASPMIYGSSSESSLLPTSSSMPSMRPFDDPRVVTDSQPIPLLRDPPRISSSPSSLYSIYSYYQLDSPSHSPKSDTLQVPPSPHAPPSRTPSLTTTPAPRNDTQQPGLADQLLQEGIQHHEANRLREAAIAFERSATTPGGSGVGMLMWGLTLRHGWGCPKNESLGFSWLRRAAEAAVGDLERARTGIDTSAVRGELVLAIYEVGQCFFQGWGVKKDQKMAMSYFQVAAKLGDVDAQQELAFCYANGRGCKKDRKEAAKWYRAAVAQGASDVGLAWIYKEKFQ